jgi:hypothetical protein
MAHLAMSGSSNSSFLTATSGTWPSRKQPSNVAVRQPSTSDGTPKRLFDGLGPKIATPAVRVHENHDSIVALAFPEISTNAASVFYCRAASSR